MKNLIEQLLKIRTDARNAYLASPSFEKAAAADDADVAYAMARKLIAEGDTK